MTLCNIRHTESVCGPHKNCSACQCFDHTVLES